MKVVSFHVCMVARLIKDENQLIIRSLGRFL
jgi:hypothetical protein